MALRRGLFIAACFDVYQIKGPRWWHSSVDAEKSAAEIPKTNREKEIKMINERYKTPIVLITIVIIALLAYVILTQRNQSSTMEKVGNAIQELPQGVDKAARQLEDRTPGEKLGDSVKDAGEKIKEESQPTETK